MNTNEAFNILNISETATQAEIKKAYKIASVKYHPDRNPNGLQMMVAINAAFTFLKGLGDTVYVKAEFNFYDFSETLNDVLDKLSRLEGLEIEVCGNWVWIGGDTKQHKNILGKNGLGCFWSKTKNKWYFRPAEYKSSFNRKAQSMDYIRESYGSYKVKTRSPNRLSA